MQDVANCRHLLCTLLLLHCTVYTMSYPVYFLPDIYIVFTFRQLSAMPRWFVVLLVCWCGCAGVSSGSHVGVGLPGGGVCPSR